MATIFLSKTGNYLYYYLSGNDIDYPVELVKEKIRNVKKNLVAPDIFIN